MKKYLTLLTAVAFVTVFSTACTQDCKNCKTRTTDASGVVLEEGTSSEYCDVSLDAKENEEPTTVGGRTTTWVCE